MNFLMTLMHRYVCFTVAIFLSGMVMRYFFDEKEEQLGKVEHSKLFKEYMKI